MSFDVTPALLAAHATNDRINHYLLQHVPDEAWSIKPASGKGRTIAAIFAHMHSVRLMWLKSAAPDAALPAKLESDFSRADAGVALESSNDALHQVIAKALATDGRIKGFKPDVCSFVAYLIAHDAHHRGQASMLARQLGHPLPQSAMFGMWEWGNR